MKSAVEMTPRGKRGKLRKQVSHSFHRAWIPANYAGTHIPTAPTASLTSTPKDKNEAQIEFQLTDDAEFTHHSSCQRRFAPTAMIITHRNDPSRSNRITHHHHRNRHLRSSRNIRLR